MAGLWVAEVGVAVMAMGINYGVVWKMGGIMLNSCQEMYCPAELGAKVDGVVLSKSPSLACDRGNRVRLAG